MDLADTCLQLLVQRLVSRSQSSIVIVSMGFVRLRTANCALNVEEELGQGLFQRLGCLHGVVTV